MGGTGITKKMIYTYLGVSRVTFWRDLNKTGLTRKYPFLKRNLKIMQDEVIRQIGLNLARPDLTSENVRIYFQNITK